VQSSALHVTKEAAFDLHELIFSITKLDSTIVSGNETFIRISGYERDEIIGRYHNIIRHPDMPRVVFKRFWDYLKAKKPVVAYVKNLSKEGLYYWVLAAVFPLGEQYISIRIKPNTPLFEKAKELYFRLLMVESTREMNESEVLFSELLSGMGFRDYDHFMYQVLLSELLERKQLLSKSPRIQAGETVPSAGEPSRIEALYATSASLLSEYQKWFEKIDSFQKTKAMFEEKGYVLRRLARDIVLLSLNASVASYKLEEHGETFSVLASDIRKNAKENDALITNVHHTVEELSASLNEIIFLISCTSLQMEMIKFFIKELVDKSETRLEQSVNVLYALVASYNESLMKLPPAMNRAIEKSRSSLGELERQFMYLGYVQVYGIIEASRRHDDRLGFNEIFSQLKSLVAKTSDEISLMNGIAGSFSSDNHLLMQEAKKLHTLLEGFGSEISHKNNQEG